MLKHLSPVLLDSRTADPGARPTSAQLRDIVVLAFDPVCGPQHPCQMAVAFMGRRSGLSWLVMPERYWGKAACRAAGRLHGRLGKGLPPTIVAQELTQAITGHRVYTEDQAIAVAFLDRLFADSGIPPPVARLGEIMASFLPQSSDKASEVLYRIRSRVSRHRCLCGSLSAEAAYHRDILRLLAARVRR